MTFVTGRRKLATVPADPPVAVSIDRATPEKVHRSVTLLGTARIVGHGDGSRERRARVRDVLRAGQPASDEPGEQAPVEVDVASVNWQLY